MKLTTLLILYDGQVTSPNALLDPVSSVRLYNFQVNLSDSNLVARDNIFKKLLLL